MLTLLLLGWCIGSSTCVGTVQPYGDVGQGGPLEFVDGPSIAEADRVKHHRPHKAQESFLCKLRHWLNMQGLEFHYMSTWLLQKRWEVCVLPCVLPRWTWTFRHHGRSAELDSLGRLLWAEGKRGKCLSGVLPTRTSGRLLKNNCPLKYLPAIPKHSMYGIFAYIWPKFTW